MILLLAPYLLLPSQNLCRSHQVYPPTTVTVPTLPPAALPLTFHKLAPQQLLVALQHLKSRLVLLSSSTSSASSQLDCAGYASHLLHLELHHR